MRKLMFGLLVGAFALAIGGQASATPTFSTVIVAVNGSPIATTGAVTIAPSDTVTVELRVSLDAGDTGIDAISMAQIFDPAVLQLVGPAAGPTTFHATCSAGGSPCPTLTSSIFTAPSGGTTPDSNPTGDVGSMGAAAFLFGPGTFTAPQSGALGQETFHAVVGTTTVFPAPFSVADGVFTGSGSTPVPFAIGAVAAITVVPEPTTAILVGLGLVGLATAGRRRN